MSIRDIEIRESIMSMAARSVYNIAVLLTEQCIGGRSAVDYRHQMIDLVTSTQPIKGVLLRKEKAQARGQI